MYRIKYAKIFVPGWRQLSPDKNSTGDGTGDTSLKVLACFISFLDYFFLSVTSYSS